MATPPTAAARRRERFHNRAMPTATGRCCENSFDSFRGDDPENRPYTVLLPQQVRDSEHINSRRTPRAQNPLALWVEPVIQACLARNPKHYYISFGAAEKLVATKHWTVKIHFPESFKELRRRFSFKDEGAFLASLRSASVQKPQEGRSGAKFSKTADNVLYIKETNKNDFTTFKKTFPAYFAYVMNQQPTLLAKTLAAFEVVVNSETFYVLVTENVAPLPWMTTEAWYDLKGVQRAGHGQNSDNGFQTPLLVTRASRDCFLRALASDVNFLQRSGLVDYSLLVFVSQTGHVLVGIIDYWYKYAWKCLRVFKNVAIKLRSNGKREATIQTPQRYATRLLNACEAYFQTA